MKILINTQHEHSIVVLGIKETGMIDVIRMFRVKKSVGVDHLEEDLNTIIYTLDNYKPDLILADEGYNMNYNDKLKAYYGINHVYGVKTRSARSNGDAVAHFSDTDNTVTIDKLSQVLLLMASLRTEAELYQEYDFIVEIPNTGINEIELKAEISLIS